MYVSASIRTRQLAAALGLLTLLLLAPVATSAPAMHREARVVCASATELAQQPIEEQGNVERVAHDATPMPTSGRLRVRESDRIGPQRLHLPPPVGHFA